MTNADASQIVAEHPSITKVGRIGWFAKGLVYLIAGLLALLVTLRAIGRATPPGAPPTTGPGAAEASPTGALKEVAQHAFGGPLLIALAIGMFAYAGWRLVAAAMPGKPDLKVRVTRAGYVVSAIIYITFGFTAIKLVSQSPATTDGNSKVTDVTASIMRHTGGRVLIGLVGVVLLGAAAYRINKARQKDVTDELTLKGWSAHHRELIRKLGAIGEFGRGVALALIGFFLVRAAVAYNANEATGLDGALRRAATHGWGRVLVVIVAVGFVCYGVFCLATFNQRHFEAPT